MFKASYEDDVFLEKTEDSTFKGDDDTEQTLSFEITHENTSPSPTLSPPNEDLLSSSAPVYILGKPENNSHSGTTSPTKDVTSPPFESLMTQSLNASLSHPKPVQRATSTEPRLEHPVDDAVSTQYPSMEDPFFPFLNPDLGTDMKISDNQFGSSNPITIGGNVNDAQSTTEIVGKKKWQIVKGMSEMNIAPSWNSQVPENNSMTGLNSSGNSNLKGKKKYATSVKFSQSDKKRLPRKISISSNLSFVGNYIFGSNIFQSPARSSTSMASDKVNYIIDPPGMYPSLMSLNSFEVEVDNNTHLQVSSQPRSVSAFNSRQNSGNDLPGLENKRFMRSNSATSRGSSSSLSTRIFRDNDDKVVKEDEEYDKVTEVKSIVGRPQQVKKHWQQTMPDLEEGPESDTLTVQSTIRNNLAAAALAMSVREKIEMIKTQPVKVVKTQKTCAPSSYSKNLIVLCFSYFACFASYMSLRNLQSSLNDAGGLGMIALSCVYASVFLGSIFTTSIIKQLRPKLSIIISFLGLLLYNIANYYPSYATLIPGSIIAGFSLAITWTAQGTYMANNAMSSSQHRGKKFPEVLSLYQGIFFSSFQLAQVVGGLISSFIFSLQTSHSSMTDLNDTSTHSFNNYSNIQNLTNSDLSPNQTTIPFNTTNFSDIHDIHLNVICGMEYCPGGNRSKLNVEIKPSLYFAMITVFVCCMILAILVLAFCLNPLEGVIKKSNIKFSTQLLYVFRMGANKSMLCLFPLMSYSLLQTTFMFGEFNKAHVTCILGIHMIGFMTVFLSLFSSIFAFLSGNLQKYLGTDNIIFTGLFCHLTIMVYFWVWVPHKDNKILFFLIVSVWGAGDGMMMAQIVSLLGTLFVAEKEVAFSTYKMVQSGSAFIMFMLGSYICTKVKVIILMLMAVLAVVGVLTLKVRTRINRIAAKK